MARASTGRVVHAPTRFPKKQVSIFKKECSGGTGLVKLILLRVLAAVQGDSGLP